MTSPRLVKCVRLGKEAEGLDTAPFRGSELGQRIFANVSKDAWREWLAHSTMLINENRLDLQTKAGTELLLKECERFFFGDGGERPKEYRPVDDANAASDAKSEKT